MGLVKIKNRALLKILVGVLLFAFIVPQKIQAAPPQGSLLPFPEYHTDPLNGILYPRIATPAFVINNGNFDVYVKKEMVDSKVSVYLTSLFTEGYEYPLDVLSTEQLEGTLVKIRVRVPEGVPKGLFNLTIKSGAVELTEPNAVYVFGEKYPDELKLVHITDTHYGTRRMPKLLKNRDLFEQLIALINGLRPDLVIHTGDLIDAIVRPDEEDPFKSMYYEMVRLRVPAIIVQGNNDNTAIEKGSYFWEKYFGPLYGVVKFGNYSFFLLDADTGRIQPEQIEWLERRIEELKQIPVKVLMLHYPYFGEDLGYYHKEKGFINVVPNISNWLNKFHFNLVLAGHWHVDNITKPPTLPTLSIVTDAGQYDDVDDYGHYRPIKLTSDGKVEYEDPSPSLALLSIKYLQSYDGSSSGVSILVSNKENREVSLILPVVLSAYRESPWIENAEILASYDHKGKGIYEIKVKVPPRKELLVKIYIEEDKVKPRVKVEPEVKEETIILWHEAFDDGLGVKEVKLFYSPDNKTWTEIKPEMETGYPVYKFKALAEKMYYKVLAEDAAGNKAEIYGTVEIPSLKPTKAPSPTPLPKKPIPLLYLAIIAVLLVAIVAIFALRRR